MSESEWESGTRFEARCVAGYPAPQFGCSCGIYALDRLRPYSLRNDVFWRPRETILVVGTASLWGTAIQHSRGWRAEYAYPLELWVVPIPWSGGNEETADALARDLARVYHVPAAGGSPRRFFGAT